MDEHDHGADHGKGQRERTTAPQQPYGTSEVTKGVAILLAGLVVTFGLAVLLA